MIRHWTSTRCGDKALECMDGMVTLIFEDERLTMNERRRHTVGGTNASVSYANTRLPADKESEG